MADRVRPRWRCGEPGCRAYRRWQPVPAARGRGDLDAALAALDAHYTIAHPDVEEEAGHVRLATAA